MRHCKRGRKLNRTSSHRKALLRNLAISLVTHKRIKTTLPKAKELSPFVERLITYAKKDNLSGYRLILKNIPGKSGKKVANILVNQIAPNYKSRNGGYTRIIKLENRKNDNAPVSLIEFVDIASKVNELTVDEEVKEKGESKK